jgi:hypothetical protein
MGLSKTQLLHPNPKCPAPIPRRWVFKASHSAIDEDLLFYLGWNPKPAVRCMVFSGVTKVLGLTHSTLNTPPLARTNVLPDNRGF